MYTGKNHSFPRWSGPFVGLVAGAFCGFRAGLRAEIPIHYWILGGAVIGAAAGLLITCLDYSPAVVDTSGFGPSGHAADKLNKMSASGVVGRFLTLTGVLLCWVPLIGFFVNLAARITNRNATDWAKRFSTIGLVVSTLVSLFVILMMILESR